jgi:hypothetical protein
VHKGWWWGLLELQRKQGQVDQAHGHQRNRGQVDQARGAGQRQWGKVEQSGKWQVSSVIVQLRLTDLGDGSIMVSGGQSFRPFELVGTQGMKAPTQMDSACGNPDAQVICQGDTRFRPKPGDMKVSGTSHQVDSVTFLFGTNSTLIVTWGNFASTRPCRGKAFLWFW